MQISFSVASRQPAFHVTSSISVSEEEKRRDKALPHSVVQIIGVNLIPSDTIYTVSSNPH